MEDFKYELIMGKNIVDDPLFPLAMGYIFTHQYTLGEYIVSFKDVVEIFKAIIEEGDRIYWNEDNNEIIIKLYLPVTKENIETVKTILKNITIDTEIEIEAHYIKMKINNLMVIKKDV